MHGKIQERTNPFYCSGPVKKSGLAFLPQGVLAESRCSSGLDASPPPLRARQRPASTPTDPMEGKR